VPPVASPAGLSDVATGARGKAIETMLPKRITRLRYQAYIERKTREKAAQRAVGHVPRTVYLAVVERCLLLEKRLAERDER